MTTLKSNPVILQVNDYDIAGGAEIVAMNLFSRYLDRGYHAFFLVGLKKGSNSRIQEIEMGHSPNLWERFWLTKAGKYKHTKDTSKISWIKYYCTKFLAHPIGTLCLLSGKPDYNFPSTWDITNLIPEKPDILHLHNLHGDYFDLRALPYISRKLPVVVTLHDVGILGYSSNDSLPVSVLHKNEAKKNSRIALYSKLVEKIHRKVFRKNAEYLEQSPLYLVSPSQWIMDLAKKSLLNPAIINFTVINNGVDLSIFHQYDKIKAREELNITNTCKILVFSANGIRQNTCKDYVTLRNALTIVADRLPNTKIVFYAIGESSASEKIGNSEIRFVPFFSDPHKMARYYQAADIYIHASHTESWGLTITESLACGTPVIATAVGGIPEQVTDGFNGFLTISADPQDMAEKIKLLLENDALRERMGQNAYEDAKVRFDLNLQIERYLAYYQEILSSYSAVER